MERDKKKNRRKNEKIVCWTKKYQKAKIMKVISEMKTKLQDTQWNRFKQKFNKWYRKKVENSQDNGNEVKKGEKEKKC